MVFGAERRRLMLADKVIVEYQKFPAERPRISATVLIQHDARDIEQLPVFPAAAKKSS
jgi:hypothetical protein